MSYGRYEDDGANRGYGRGRPERDRDFGRDEPGEEMVGRVKWFDSGKGFGFVKVEGVDKDPFLHVSVLGAFGLQDIAEGATLRFVATRGQKGLTVSAIQGVDESTSGPMGRDTRDRPPQRGGFDRGPRGAEAPVADRVLEAELKWFNQERGFGFFADPGGTDIFVHVSAVQSSGLRDLREGDRYRIHVGRNRGRVCVLRVETL